MPECPSRSCQTAALPGDGLRLPSWVGAFSPREGKRSPFMRMEAIRLLLCVLYVRSRATFSIRHPLGAHSVIVRNLSGMCLFFRTLAGTLFNSLFKSFFNPFLFSTNKYTIFYHFSIFIICHCLIKIRVSI